jgi:hypothetical protein
LFHRRVRTSDSLSSFESMEFEARKLDCECDFLREDLSSLETRRRRLDAMLAFKLEQREHQAATLEFFINGDAEEMEAGLVRGAEMKKVLLRQAVVERRAAGEAARARFALLKEEATKQTRIVDKIASEVAVSIQRGVGMKVRFIGTTVENFVYSGHARSEGACMPLAAAVAFFVFTFFFFFFFTSL